MRRRSSFLFSACLLLLSWNPSIGLGVCVEPAGDVTLDGAANVIDVQCAILGALYHLEISGGTEPEEGYAIPDCVQDNINRTDLDCSGTTNVTDILTTIYLALDIPLNSEIDENGDLCNDACQDLCGDNLCGESESCSSCPEDCGTCTGVCCEANGTIGCDNANMSSCVCSLQSECCTVAWDEGCVAATASCGEQCDDPDKCKTCPPEEGEEGGEPCVAETGPCMEYPWCQVPDDCPTGEVCVDPNLGPDSSPTDNCAYNGTTETSFCKCEKQMGANGKLKSPCTNTNQCQTGLLCDAKSGLCSAPDPSPCCVSKPGKTGCADDIPCESCVCNALPYCCELAWDEACVQCGAGQGCGEQDKLSCEAACHCPEVPEANNECCEDKDTAGCGSNLACEACVCALEPACCDVAWDGPCDIAAAGLCNEDCGCFEKDGSCCEANDSPGCESFSCEDCVCGENAACCDVLWDEGCATMATTVCQKECPCEYAGVPEQSDGCTTSPASGASNEICENCVCALNSFCCEFGWDSICTLTAKQLCEQECGCNDADCCSAKSAPGCDQGDENDSCETCVCAIKPGCCEENWTEECGQIAETLTGVGGCASECGCAPTLGSCCGPHGGEGCFFKPCESCVCDWMPACCDLQWDAQCATIAETGTCAPECGCPAQGGDCCSPHATGGCDDTLECTPCVCALDHSCCDTAWDDTCVKRASEDCVDECGCTGSCCEPHNSAGCSKPACEDCVCDEASICCEVAWLFNCTEIAHTTCDDSCKCDEEGTETPEEGGDPGEGANEGAGEFGEGNEEDAFGEEGSYGDESPDTMSGGGGGSWGAESSGEESPAEEGGDPQEGGEMPAEGGEMGEPEMPDISDSPCCAQPGTAGCDGCACETCVCETYDPYCCEVEWDSVCADTCMYECGGCPEVKDLILANEAMCPEEPAKCGDGTCSPEFGEDCNSCALDCGTCCGDGICDPYSEDCGSCPLDCGECGFCGDGTCDGPETAESCPQDCPVEVACGDGICDDDTGETCETCAKDCGVELPDGEYTCCNNGICDNYETCNTCPEDCKEPDPCPGECGDGTCVAEEQETCESCPADCGECPKPCGDGVCNDDTEDCLNCPIDCGECQCQLFGEAGAGVSWGEETTIAYNFLGTGVDLEVEAEGSALTIIGEEGCKGEIQAKGEIRVCGKILYNGVCIAGGTDLDLLCTEDIHCPNPPTWTCDSTTECCDTKLKGYLQLTRTWNPKKSFGPASCELILEAGLKGSETLLEQEGPGCDCEGKSLIATATLLGKGGGKCTAKAFGKSLVVEAGAKADACVGRSFSEKCKNGNRWVKGASFSIHLGPVKIGWLFTFEYEKKFQAGDDC